MCRNKALLMALLLCLFASQALAQSDSLISEEMVKTETVNYKSTFVVEEADYERVQSAQASTYYPYTYTLRFEGDNAKFKEFLVTRKKEVKAGDVLATFTLDVDEVGLASKRMATERAQIQYDAAKLEKSEAIEQMLLDQADITDPYERELMTLRIKRAKVALEQYCYEQERQIAKQRKEIAELEEAYSKTSIIAPFDGVVTEIQYKREGERLYKNEALLTLQREDGMLLRVDNSSGRFRYGMQVEIAFGPASDRTYYSGRIIAADTMLPESRRTGHAFIQSDEPLEMTNSRFTQPNISAATYRVENVLIIPRKALTLDAGKNYVNKLVDGVLQKRCVNVAMNNNTDAWVIQGLEAGDIIVID